MTTASPLHRTRLLVLLATAVAATAAAAPQAAPGSTGRRVVTLAGDEVLVFRGTSIRCALDRDEKSDRVVGIRCMVVNPAIDAQLEHAGVGPRARPGSYVVHATYRGGALMTHAVLSRVKFDGKRVVTVERVVKSAEGPLSGKGFSLSLGNTVTFGKPLPMVRAGLGDDVRVKGTPILCTLARASTGTPTIGCGVADSQRVLVNGTYGFLLAKVAAALASASSSRGFHPFLIREFGH